MFVALSSDFFLIWKKQHACYILIITATAIISFYRFHIFSSNLQPNGVEHGP